MKDNIRWKACTNKYFHIKTTNATDQHVYILDNRKTTKRNQQAKTYSKTVVTEAWIVSQA